MLPKYRESVMIFAVFDLFLYFIWEKVFKSGPSKIWGRQPLKNSKGNGLLKQLKAVFHKFLKAVFHKSWILCPIWCCRYKFWKVKIFNKSKKIVSHDILSFSVHLQTISIKIGSWLYILMANEVYIVIFTLYF